MTPTLPRSIRVLAVFLLTTVMTGITFAQQQAKLLGTLNGHTDPVYAVAWSPDGKTIATAGFDNTVRLWEAASRKEIKSFEGHTKIVLAVAFSPDGRQLASASLDNTAKVWDLPGGGPARTLTGQASAVAALAVKPDGKEAAVAAGKSVRVWDLAKSAPIKELEGFASEVASVAWRQDGAQIAAGDRSHAIRLWKGDFTSDGVIETPADAVLGLAYVPGKPLLISAGSDGVARLWRLPVAEPMHMDPKGAIGVFAVSHEGNRAGSAGTDKVVRVWTLAGRQAHQGDYRQRPARGRAGASVVTAARPLSGWRTTSSGSARWTMARRSGRSDRFRLPSRRFASATMRASSLSGETTRSSESSRPATARRSKS